MLQIPFGWYVVDYSNELKPGLGVSDGDKVYVQLYHTRSTPCVSTYGVNNYFKLLKKL